MAKKFGKFLLFVSTIGAAFAGAYYFMKNRQSNAAGEDDYEDLDDDSEEESDGERSYVSLNTDSANADSSKSDAKDASGTTVEEFFDDDDDDSDGSLDAI